MLHAVYRAPKERRKKRADLVDENRRARGKRGLKRRRSARDCGDIGATKKLTRSQILAVDKDLWPYARNEIYARHGYQFKKAKYRNYFSQKSWYSPGGFSTGDLSATEWYNMELLKEMEEEYGVR